MCHGAAASRSNSHGRSRDDGAAVNDDVLDGTQPASISASATGYSAGSDSVDVTDHETLTLVITHAVIAENAGIGAATATVTRSNSDNSQELVVSLTNSDASATANPSSRAK